MSNTYRIKPLEWEKRGDEYRAETPFGSYYAGEDHWSYCFDEYYDDGRHQVPSLAAAKKAAWEHWCERLAGALDPVEEKAGA